MVFVSLEGFLEGGVSATRVAVPHAQRPPQAPVHVVVTPGSPAKPTVGHKRSRLRRATSAFSSLAKSASPTDVAAAGVAGVATAAADAFVVYVTDRDVHHKWVLAKSPDELAALKKALQSELTRCACRAFACCGPLRRVAASAQYKAPKRRWSDSRVVSQFGRCGAVQEFLNDLLLAVLRRDAECDATRAAWRALSAFLDVETQRTEVADKIVLRTVGDHQHHQHLRRSLSEQLPARRTSCAGECHADKPDVHTHCCGSDAGSDTDTSDPDDEDGECPICCAPLLLEAAAADEPTPTTARLLCGHAYHAECVRVWLRMQHTCPVCRIPIEGM